MQYMQKTDVVNQNNSASIQNLEAQILRIAGTLPSNTIINLNEHVKAITLRSGQAYDQPQSVNTERDEEATKNVELEKKEIEYDVKETDREDILSNKRKLEEYETEMLTEESSTILQKKLPPRLKDPRSFTIPCTIVNFYFDKVLYNLEASINLMPLSVFRKLGVGEAKPTTISLQLADKSIKYPRGLFEDVLVKVGKFSFPPDFVALDMEEDEEILLILGQPFLTKGRTLIDVQQAKLILRVSKEQVTFDVFKSMKF
ncbi:hypothetical protein F2P56_018704 [Juglans regia]|uniref:Uncharacterized protein LOC109000428 n=2 Tax=Juglans regia TaxID=51240 RepID=A0A2I4FMF2_JUGRE|nr:uncharacterized protein LOC109000428 [Juglans regia]KAF5462721.1 hypothetical protein F2P56_018704 [Juglans regia]